MSVRTKRFSPITHLHPHLHEPEADGYTNNTDACPFFSLAPVSTFRRPDLNQSKCHQCQRPLAGEVCKVPPHSTNVSSYRKFPMRLSTSDFTNLTGKMGAMLGGCTYTSSFLPRVLTDAMADFVRSHSCRTNHGLSIRYKISSGHFLNALLLSVSLFDLNFETSPPR